MLTLLATTLLTASALAQAPGHFDPRSLRAHMAGPPTRILVLGTAHLTQMPATFKVEFLAPLLDRLAAFRPDIITIEGLSGPDCEYLTRYKATLPGVADDYCWDTDPAFKATGLDLPAATAAVDKTLRAWPAQPTPAQRRRLASLFLAANDRASAAVQWMRLPPAERHAGDGMDEALVAALTKVVAGRNENVTIAAALAARLGQERVYPVDDHSADSVIANLGPDFEQAIQKVWAMPSTLKGDFKARQDALHDGDGVLSLYRMMNAPATNQVSIDEDMGRALRQSTPQLYGRQYVGWWETRNLRMAANIRSAYANRPGARVLSVVGFNHKAYFETYLRMMTDVDLVDAATVLGSTPGR